MLNRSVWLASMALVAAGLMVISCGDDESPAGPGNDPTESVLTAVASGTNSVLASWTQCPDGDFSEYRLYRATSPGISGNPPASPVRVSTAADDTTFTDAGLAADVYYYAVQTRNTGGGTAWSNEVSVTIDSAGCGVLTCAEVQGQQSSSPYEGEEVLVTGIVVVGGDELYNSTGPVAVIADPGGGPWSGLVLFGDSIASLGRGDSVVIGGPVYEHYGLTEISPVTSVEIVSTGNDLPPVTTVNTGDIATSKADVEQYEAVMLRIEDAMVTDLHQYNWSVDDGSGECFMDDLGDITWEPAVGDTVNSAVGVLWYSFSEWKLNPRDDNDLDVGGGGGGGDVLTCYEVQGQQSSSPYDGETVTVTGIVVAGGGELYGSSAQAVIMDAGGGAWHGLTIFGDDVSNLARGDSVTITGPVQEYYGFTEISFPTSVEVHSSGHTLPDASVVDTGDAGEEQWESVLVEVRDVEVVEEADEYGQWKVDDDSGELMVDDLGDYSYTASLGDTFSSIVGVLWFSFDDFKLQPRDDDDLTQ